MEIFIAMGVFFIVVTAIFVAVAVFLPEWIGITGHRAKEIMREQQGDWVSPEDPAKVHAAEVPPGASTSLNPSDLAPPPDLMSTVAPTPTSPAANPALSPGTTKLRP